MKSASRVSRPGRRIALTVVAAAVAVAVALAVASLAAQAPLVNARVERRAVSQGLAREVQAAVDRGVPLWVGYSVPILRRQDASPQGTGWCCGRCRLEPPTELLILVRAESKVIGEIRSLAVDCDVDAGGMPLVWLDGVNADESVAWLASMVDTAAAAPRDRRSDAALHALAQHASNAAAAPLVRFARDSASTPLRSRALSLLAQRAADDAIPTIDAAIEKDPEKAVRRQAVLALSRLPRGQGVPRLMELAGSHRDPEIRRQAMLALGQSRDPRAVDFFAQVLK